MGRIVAIKILSSGAVRSVEYVERFRRKVKALARLSHPNLVTAFDAGESGGRPYLVMEYVDGDNWASVLRTSGPGSPASMLTGRMGLRAEGGGRGGGRTS